MYPPIYPALFRAALLCAVAATLAGCAQTPRLDRAFGASVRLATAAQTLNPQAWRNPDPVLGMDGKSAAAAYDNYVKSFQAPVSQSNAFTIGGVGKH